MRRILALLIFVLPIALAAMITSQLVAQAPGPARVDQTMTGLAVRVAPVEAGPLVPVARGWGNVRAAQTWTAVSEVRGSVVWHHPDLASGRLIPAGTVVLRIDPADYRLAIAQAEADLDALRAEAAQIEAEELNTRRVMALEEARLALSESDAARVRELVAQGTAAPTRADEAERAVLGARRIVVELQNALALFPSRRDRNAAQVARTDAAMARARRDLDHTEITVPFDLRVTEAPVEMYQYVTVGQRLAVGEGLARAEILAQVSIASFQRLLAGFQIDGETLEAMHQTPSMGVTVTVAPVSNPEQTWEGRVTRLEPALEARARTVQVVIEVDDPYSGARPPERIPLVGNLQVEVTLTGPAHADIVTIPESALHDGLVYLADADDRLELRPVEVAFRQGGVVAVAAGLEPGERLVLDDIAPALPGLRLLPVAP
ncbi:MAG: HlyD family efflux transporter periplasmic adaptor subunit [Pararhodobacter sp.]|nr:HlyD family efflux transporter periplasmic adaptor subunit [Pararhodobacter sp.]